MVLGPDTSSRERVVFRNSNYLHLHYTGVVCLDADPRIGGNKGGERLCEHAANVILG